MSRLEKYPRCLLKRKGINGIQNMTTVRVSTTGKVWRNIAILTKKKGINGILSIKYKRKELMRGFSYKQENREKMKEKKNV